MNRVARLVGLSAGFTFVFIVALLVSHAWLQRHTAALRQEALRAKKLQFERTLALADIGAPPWDDALAKSLGDAIGGEIVVQEFADAEPGRKRAPADGWSFSEVFEAVGGSPAREVEVNFQPPPAARLAHMLQQAAAMLLALALVLLFFLGTAIMWGNRGARTAIARDDEPAVTAAGGEVSSLAQLARVSSRQLEIERNERLRLEEDLNVQQMLLNRTLEEKIRLGQDLHDGIIQSLYATGLTLEAAKNLLARDPGGAQRQLETSLQALNSTIREVRGYIHKLAADETPPQSFAESVHALARLLAAGRSVVVDAEIAPDVAARLDKTQSADLLQIVREALSNSLRHGAPERIIVSLCEKEGRVDLAIRDDGHGFDPVAARARGHGLANMRARARRVGSTLEIVSAKGAGTCIALAVPVATVPASR